jgi:hypothetical protein
MVPDEAKLILNLPLLKWLMLSWAVRDLFRGLQRPEHSSFIPNRSFWSLSPSSLE